METWWEYELAVFIASMQWGEKISILWYLASVWFWTPLFTWFSFRIIPESATYLPFFPLPVILILSGLSAYILSITLQQKSPCQLDPILQITGPIGQNCMNSYHSLPNLTSAVWSTCMGFCLFHKKKIQYIEVVILVIAFISALLANFLLVQAFFSDLMAGILWGILISFVFIRLNNKQVVH